MSKSTSLVHTNTDQRPDRTRKNGRAPVVAWDYRAAFDRSPGPVIVTNAAGLHIDANPAALAFLGYERDEWLRLTTRDLVSAGPTWSPEGAERFIQEGRWEGEVEIRTKKDSLATYARVVVLPEAEGGLHVTFLQDLGERQRSEETRSRLAALVTSSYDAIVGWSIDGIITDWNPAAERLYGYTAAEVIGLPITLIIPPDLRPEFDDLFARAREGHGSEGFETIRLAKDGRRIDVSLTISPVWNDARQISGGSTITRDISARKAAEAVLAASEHHFREVMASREVAQEPRESEEQYRTLVHHVPATDPAAMGRITAAGTAGRDLRKTLLTSRKDGAAFWIELHMAAARDEGEALTHVVGIQSDVTAPVEPREALARERDLLKAMMDQLPDPVYVKDTASRFLRLNQATARQLGISDPAMAIGKTDHDFFPVQQADEYRGDERRLMETGVPMLSKLERQTDGENDLWRLASKAPLRDASGKIVGLVGSNHDVTERLQTTDARDRLAAIIESAEDAIISRALDGTIATWNHGAERLYGYAADEAIGRPFTILFPEGDQTAARADSDASRASVTRFETRRRRSDGAIVDVSITKSPIRDDHGETIGASTITRDITERKRFEQELRAALDAAEAGVRTKTLFLAMMSHELRTPLQAVLGYTDVLLLGPDHSLSAEQREDLGYIRGGAGRMIALIEQLLDLSRMEAGRLVFETTAVDPREIIELVRQDVAPQAAAKGLELLIDLPASLPNVQGDPGRLRQILLNLAGNAVKFTQRGSVRISASLSAAGVAVAVRDTGIGISVDALPIIFEEFRQVDGNLTRRYGGAGLGLAIASRLAEQMGGAITAVSTPGDGSTFTLHMPQAKP